MKQIPAALYVAIVLVAVFFGYLGLNIVIGIFAPIAHATAINPAAAPFPTFQGMADWSPLALYFMPALAGLLAIVLRFREDIAAQFNKMRGQ